MTALIWVVVIFVVFVFCSERWKRWVRWNVSFESLTIVSGADKWELGPPINIRNIKVCEIRRLKISKLAMGGVPSTRFHTRRVACGKAWVGGHRSLQLFVDVGLCDDVGLLIFIFGE